MKQSTPVIWPNMTRYWMKMTTVTVGNRSGFGQKNTIILPSGVSNGLSIISILEKNDCVITGFDRTTVDIVAVVATRAPGQQYIVIVFGISCCTPHRANMKRSLATMKTIQHAMIWAISVRSLQLSVCWGNKLMDGPPSNTHPTIPAFFAASCGIYLLKYSARHNLLCCTEVWHG